MAANDRFEIPPEMRAFAEKSVDQARQAFDGFIAAAHNAVSAFEGQAETARKGAKDVTVKAINFAEQNIASSFELAQQLLRAGKLAAFPTETVYGLGADATNPQAVAGIFAAKGRPQDHPVIVHLADVSQLGEWAVEIPEAARKLADAEARWLKASEDYEAAMAES